jgi:hypothetical protein
MTRAADTGRGGGRLTPLRGIVATLVPVTVGIVAPIKVGTVVAICEACVGEARHDLGFIMTAPIGSDFAGFYCEHTQCRPPSSP